VRLTKEFSKYIFGANEGGLQVCGPPSAAGLRRTCGPPSFTPKTHYENSLVNHNYACATLHFTCRLVQFTSETSRQFFMGLWSPSISHGLMLVRDSMSNVQVTYPWQWPLKNLIICRRQRTNLKLLEVLSTSVKVYQSHCTNLVGYNTQSKATGDWQGQCKIWESLARLRRCSRNFCCRFLQCSSLSTISVSEWTRCDILPWHTPLPPSFSRRNQISKRRKPLSTQKMGIDKERESERFSHQSECHILMI